jgi:hypothetical protein
MLKKANVGVATLALAATLVAGSALAATSMATKAPQKKKAAAKAASLKSATKAKAKSASSTTGVNTSSAAPGFSDSLSASQAAPAAAAATSTAQATTVAPSIRQRIGLTYENLFYGPTVTEMGSAVRSDLNTGAKDAGDPVLMRHRLKPAFAINDVLKADLVLEARHGFSDNGQVAQFRDPYLRLTNAKLINSGNFNVLGDVRLGLPVGDESAETTKIGFISARQLTTYQIKRLTLGVETLQEQRLYSNNAQAIAKGGQRGLYLYAGPMASYQLTPTLAATALYEMEAAHAMGDSAILSASKTSTDLEVGLSWDVTPAVNLSPTIMMYPGNRLATDTSTVNAYLTWKLL